MIGSKRFRIRKKECRFACFEPAEVGMVAGLPPLLEEEWDRAGLMPWGNSARQPVSAVPVVELALTHELSSRGWQFEGSELVVGRGIARVFFFALLAVDGACEVTGLPHLVDRFRGEFMENSELAASLTCEEEMDRFLYRNGDQGEFEYGRNLQAIIDKSATSSLCLIDLQGVATRLCSRAARPLLGIELIDEEPSSAERTKWLSTSRI